MEDLQPIIITIIILFIIVGFWSAISLLISRLSGWHRISEYYWGKLEHYNKRLFFQGFSTSMLGGYSNFVTYAVSDEYLGISVFFLYRIGHPPLKIPLADINGIQKNMLFIPRVHLQLRKLPDKRVIIPYRLAQKIEKASGGAWTFERPLS